MKKIFTGLLFATLCLGQNMNFSSKITKSAFKSDAIYSADFENVNINKDNPPDQITGFIWVNDYINSKTEMHNSSNMFNMSMYDGSISILGGFGVSLYNNLGRLKKGESYTTSTYIEMHNLEKMCVEYVGGDDYWGSVFIYPDGHFVTNNGDNMVQVSYVNNVLQFTFTMSFNNAENVNGYIKFTGYNCSNAHVYLDDVQIYKADYAYYENFTNYDVGVLDTLSYTYHGNFYSQTGDLTSNVQILSNSNNKYLSWSYTPNTTNGIAFGYINRLGFLNRGRNYHVSLDLETLNLRNLYIYYGGTWLSNPKYFKYDLVMEEAQFFGDTFNNATYVNNVFSFDFNVNNLNQGVEYKQLMLIGEAKNANQLVRLNIDNLKFSLEAKYDYLEVDSSSAKTIFQYGEEYSKNGLIVKVFYTDGAFDYLNENEYEVLGYDMYKKGKQVLTVAFNDVFGEYSIVVERKAESIELDLANTKLEYHYGESIDLSKLVVNLKYVDGGKEEIQHGAAKDGYSIDLNGYNPYQIREYEIFIIYENIKTSFNVKVLDDATIVFNVTYKNN